MSHLGVTQFPAALTVILTVACVTPIAVSLRSSVCSRKMVQLFRISEVFFFFFGKKSESTTYCTTLLHHTTYSIASIVMVDGWILYKCFKCQWISSSFCHSFPPPASPTAARRPWVCTFSEVRARSDTCWVKATCNGRYIIKAGLENKTCVNAQPKKIQKVHNIYIYIYVHIFCPYNFPTKIEQLLTLNFNCKALPHSCGRSSPTHPGDHLVEPRRRPRQIVGGYGWLPTKVVSLTIHAKKLRKCSELLFRLLN